MSKRSEAQSDGPTRLGDFDPSDPAQLAAVVRHATKFFAGGILGLSTADRADLEAEAQLAALEAASNFSAETAKTTPWKHATNAANYAARRFLKSRMVEVPVSQFPSRSDAGKDGASDDDAGETLEADILEDDLPWYRDEDDPGPAYRPTKEELATAKQSREAEKWSDAARQLAPHDKEPDATILRRWDDPLSEIAAETGLSLDAVKARRKRLRVRVQAVAEDHAGALPPDPSAFSPSQSEDEPAVGPLPRQFEP